MFIRSWDFGLAWCHCHIMAQRNVCGLWPSCFSISVYYPVTKARYVVVLTIGVILKKPSLKILAFSEPCYHNSQLEKQDRMGKCDDGDSANCAYIPNRSNSSVRNAAVNAAQNEIQRCSKESWFIPCWIQNK